MEGIKFVMKDSNPEDPTTQLDTNELTPESIKPIHKIRQELLRGIQLGDLDIVNKMGRVTFQILGGDELNILKRVPDNKARALKNILLSLNARYNIEAEKGGLSPLQSHLMSEKYAIMIEHAENISQLEEIHSKMLNEYADPTIRITKSENLGIVEQAENYIEMNFAEDISTEEMAEKLHVHPSHLMRVFKKEKGITISKYRNLKRTKKAKDLILSSNLSMTDIAIMVGIKHPQYFSTLFKEVEGLTPVEFKKRNKNK